MLASAALYNQWIAANPSLAAGDLVSVQKERKLHPALGEISFTLRNRVIRCAGMAQALWHFDRAATRARALTGPARAQFDALIRETGGEKVMAISLARPIKRENSVLVVG